MEKLDFQKLNGLLPAIIQDAQTKQVLMLGFMNKEALEKTQITGKVTFYSRSKKRLWTKGETSGNFLNVVQTKIDCDSDTLLILVHPTGPVCHKGQFSCFGKEDFSLAVLQKIIADRKKHQPANSYTTSLFKAGLDRIIQKLGEEAVEVVIAAKNSNEEDFKNEISDLLFNIIVLLQEKEISLQEIEQFLGQRHENMKKNKH